MHRCLRTKNKDGRIVESNIHLMFNKKQSTVQSVSLFYLAQFFHIALTSKQVGWCIATAYGIIKHNTNVTKTFDVFHFFKWVERPHKFFCSIKHTKIYFFRVVKISIKMTLNGFNKKFKFCHIKFSIVQTLSQSICVQTNSTSQQRKKRTNHAAKNFVRQILQKR